MKNTLNGPYFIVGTNHRGSDAVALLESLPEGEPLLLEREPGNKFDANAVKVIARNVCVGYVRAAQNGGLSALIDRTGMAMDGLDGLTLPGVFQRTQNSKIPQVVLFDDEPPTAKE